MSQKKTLKWVGRRNPYLRIPGGEPFRMVMKQRSESTMSLMESGITDANNPAAAVLLTKSSEAEHILRS